jgi:mutator protein MutT
VRERHKVVPAAFVVVQDGDQVLIQRRFNTGFRDGEYEVAAGHVEAGETPQDAAIRELYEEVGLKATPNDLELFHIVTNDFETANKPYLYMFFKVNLSDCEGNFQTMEPEKCDDMRLFPLSDLPPLVPHVAKALEYLNSQKVTFSNMSDV